jgi:hypothetical protein
MRHHFWLGFFGCLVLTMPKPADAWGAEGHRLVARIAEQALDQQARDRLHSLLGSESLADASVWLDQEKQRLRHDWPGSERWHYDDWPVCETAPHPERYCRQGQCASEAYTRALRVLANRAAPRQDRLEALRVVVHVLEDIHQPLHAADHGDRGGNQIEVLFGHRRRPISLHSLWDGELVRRAVTGIGENDFVSSAMRSEEARRKIDLGDLATWMAESHRLARDYAYGRLPGFECDRASPARVTLSDSYVDGATIIVRDRLVLAGNRLAVVLAAAL